MATKIKILVACPAPRLQMARTLKWIQRFVGEDPANVELKRTDKLLVFQLVSKENGEPVQASQQLRNWLETQEVELIDNQKEKEAPQENEPLLFIFKTNQNVLKTNA